MLMQVGDFCGKVESNLSGLVDELQQLTGRFGEAERHAWMSSLPKLSVALAKPQLQPLHLHLGQSAGMALEYRLPASSSWCDVVLLGRTEKKPAAVILELKDWQLEGDRPGPREGLIEHKGVFYPLAIYPIVPTKHLRNTRALVAKQFALSKDVLRHTFISMFVAKFRSLGEAALQAGNSEAIIRKHYLDLKSAAEADAFFSILPKQPDESAAPVAEQTTAPLSHAPARAVDVQRAA